MILKYYPQPETGENWLILRRIGATRSELWRPLTDYRAGARLLHLSTHDRVRLDTLASMGLTPKARATTSQIYEQTGTGHAGRYVVARATAETTKREPRATLVLPHRECYEFVAYCAER